MEEIGQALKRLGLDDQTRRNDLNGAYVVEELAATPGVSGHPTEPAASQYPQTSNPWARGPGAQKNMAFDDATVREKHAGSRVPDFFCSEHGDHEAKVLRTITVSDFDSAAFAATILRRHPEVVAFEDKTAPMRLPAWPVVAGIADTKFSARLAALRTRGAVRRPTVVMPHHAPHRHSLALRFAEDWSSGGFIREMPAELSSSCRCRGYMGMRTTASTARWASVGGAQRAVVHGQLAWEAREQESRSRLRLQDDSRQK